MVSEDEIGSRRLTLRSMSVGSARAFASSWADLHVEFFGCCGEVFQERRTEPACESLSIDLYPVPVAAVLLALPSRLSVVARKWDRGEGDGPS